MADSRQKGNERKKGKTKGDGRKSPAHLVNRETGSWVEGPSDHEYPYETLWLNPWYAHPLYGEDEHSPGDR